MELIPQSDGRPRMPVSSKKHRDFWRYHRKLKEKLRVCHLSDRKVLTRPQNTKKLRKMVKIHKTCKLFSRIARLIECRPKERQMNKNHLIPNSTAFPLDNGLKICYNIDNTVRETPNINFDGDFR